MLGAIALSALGIVGALVGLTFYLVRRGDKRTDKVLSLTERLADRQVKVADLRRAVETRDNALEAAKESGDRLKRTLRVVEKQRDNAINELVIVGDPDGVAAGINAELSALRDLFGDGAAAPEDPDDS